MRIVISPKTEKTLLKLPKIDQIAIGRKIRNLPQLGKTQHEEKLAGFHNIYRVRIGNYRIVYRKIPEEIYIILIGHRKDIYDLLKQLFK